MIKQLKANPVKLQKYLKHSAPKKRSCGEMLRKCRRCGRTGGQIWDTYVQAMLQRCCPGNRIQEIQLR